MNDKIASSTDNVQINLRQIINYCRRTLGMSEIAIMQLWHYALAGSLAEIAKPESSAEPPTGPGASGS